MNWSNTTSASPASLAPTASTLSSSPPTFQPTLTLLPSFSPTASTGSSGLPLLSSGEGMTLQAIAFTLGGGLCVTLLAITAFGVAVMKKSTHIAPRCTARHGNTIYRSRSDIYKSKRGVVDGGDGDDEAGGGEGFDQHRLSMTASNYETAALPLDVCKSFHNGGNSERATRRRDNMNTAHPQDRGNPFVGWIPWTLHLSYDRMLRGIPGTGTREGGMKGKLLGVNLDAVVLFRFHDLCLRITAAATFFNICIILPLNLSACNGYTTEFCSSANLTNYGRTTIANLIQTYNTTTVTTDDLHFWTEFFWTSSSSSHLMRLYTISLCTWAITWYTLKNVKREWRENLVLRRVYYLEADHYGNRQSELDKTIYSPEDDDSNNERHDDNDDDDIVDIHKRRAINKGLDTEKTVAKYKIRQPWIPDPEHRDTIPNIELYSVLVGGLPSLPTEVVNSEDMETAIGFSRRASIDWQLAVATTFFDHCVPNQPGFSSSVVAVTILPAAPELAKAWRKWYAAAAALRRLRFIRNVINEKRHYDIDEVGGDEESSTPPSPITVTGDIVPADFHSQHTPLRENIPQDRPRVTFIDDETAINRFEDAETNRQISQYRKAYGQSEATDLDYRIFRSLNYGPEQQAVYSREMAQGAAACCPNGCGEGRVRAQPIDRLLEMEEATIERLENAQEQLQQAQLQAAVSIVDKNDNPLKSKKGKSFDETEMMLQNTDSAAKATQAPSSSASYCTNEGVELPMHDILSFSNDESELQQDLTMKGSSNQWGSSSSKCKDSDGGSHDEQNITLTKDLSSHKSLVVDIAHSKGSSDANSKNNRISANGNIALNTIGEDSPIIGPNHVPPTQFNMVSPSSIPQQPQLATMRMNSEGKFLFNSKLDIDDGSSSASAFTNTLDKNGTDVSLPTEPSLRRRALTAQSFKTNKSDAETTSSNQWEQVQNILRKDDTNAEGNKKGKDIETGVWTVPTLKTTTSSVKRSFMEHLRAICRWTSFQTRNNPLSQKIAKDSTYAVVTFSSRQAAVAARHCVADGRGVERWLSLETVPVPPLADAAPCDLITCRGCCRPVTLNLNQNQLTIRKYIALASLVFIYIFYTIPITATQKVVEPSNLQTTLPGLYDFFNESAFLSVDLISGMVSGLLYTTFFALCPVMFKMIANAGSQATSVQEAEKYALHYYWYFMLTTAFVFTYFADAAIDLWYHSNVEQSLSQLANNIANATPLRTSATWLNWILVRTTMTLPLQYMLQVNTFVFSCVGLKCCARCTMGGGPGGPIPYRIYIDGGVVFVCVIALAPQSPLVAPIALLYYVVCTPLWRRNCIFMYRPKFDSGGERWPFLSDVMITSLYMGQFLLTLQFLLRDAFGPALFAGLPAIPTYLYRNYLHKRFKRAYEDAGLLQTSLLDGWDNTVPTSAEKREEFRRFLVDAHKAAYIPVCIAGGATNILTAEPAVVIPNEDDDLLGYSDLATSIDQPFDPPESPYFGSQLPKFPSSRGSLSGGDGIPAVALQTNRGAYMRRTMSLSTPRSSVHQMNSASAGSASGADNRLHSFSQNWQKAQEELESVSMQMQSGDPECIQQ